MPINFNLLEPVQPKQGVIANLPVVQPTASGGGGDGGIGELLSGLSGLIGKKSGSTETQSENTGVNPEYSPQSPTQGLQQVLGGNPQQTINPNTGSIFNNAKSLIGQNEQNPVLAQYLQKANPGLNPAVTPWCAGFVGSVLNSTGIKGTGSLAARSYLNYGQATDKPTLGDIVVLNRQGDQSNTLGHVGFYAGTDKNGNVQVLGGNQNNSVSTQSYSPDRILGFRVPLNGQQVAKIAQQNNIQNPQQLAQLPKQYDQSQMMAKNDNPFSPQSIVQAAQAAYPNNPSMAKLAASQAILESGIGNGKPSGLAQKNNLFGIKGKGTAGSITMPTSEYINGNKVRVQAGFAANESINDSFNQHRDLMNRPRYAGVQQAGSLEEAANAVQKAGYATDPSYSKKLTDVYNKQLAQYFDNSEPNNNPNQLTTSPNILSNDNNLRSLPQMIGGNLLSQPSAPVMQNMPLSGVNPGEQHPLGTSNMPLIGTRPFESKPIPIQNLPLQSNPDLNMTSNNIPIQKYFDPQQKQLENVPTETLQQLLQYFDGGRDDYAMNSRALPGTGQVPIRNLSPADIEAIMRAQGAQGNIIG